MPIQLEKKIFPQTVVPPPAKEEELFQWAHNISRAYEELVRQVTDKYNGHIDQTHPHPKGWPYLRVQRPGFKYSASDKVVVEASATKPAYFKIGDELLEATSDLTLDIDLSGPGGLRVGLTKAANTAYYLYAVNNSGAVALIADTVAPSTGLTGYTDWTYLGAFATDQGAATITPFISSRGFYYADNEIEVESHTGGTSQNAETFQSLPVTAKQAAVFLITNGANANSIGRAMGSNTSNNNGVLQYNIAATSGNATNGLVSIFTDQTIYLQVAAAGNTVECYLMGWIEDPSEYK